jgi:hypothetical protein
MISLQLSCLTVIVIAGLVMYLSPQFAPFGIGIIVVSRESGLNNPNGTGLRLTIWATP